MSTSDSYFNGLSKDEEKKKRDPPFSLRLTFEERAALNELAGDEAIGSYIKRNLFQGTKLAPRKPRRRPRKPVKDEASLARVLALLGNSRIANNLNQLAKMANMGTLPVMPDTVRDIRRACADIALMRRDLLRALGHRTDTEPS